MTASTPSSFRNRRVFPGRNRHCNMLCCAVPTTTSWHHDITAFAECSLASLAESGQTEIAHNNISTHLLRGRETTVTMTMTATTVINVPGWRSCVHTVLFVLKLSTNDLQYLHQLLYCAVAAAHAASWEHTTVICTDTKKPARTHSTSTHQEDQTFNQTSSATAAPKKGATTAAVAQNTTHIYCTPTIFLCLQPRVPNSAIASPHLVKALHPRIPSPHLQDDCPDTLDVVRDNIYGRYIELVGRVALAVLLCFPRALPARLALRGGGTSLSRRTCRHRRHRLRMLPLPYVA